jgi:hypothetical protein
VGKYFYSHIIETTEISLEIGELDIPKEDRAKLIALAEENLHHSLLDLVLTHLSEEDKKTFLSHLVTNDHKSAWDFIVSRVENAEQKIIDTALKIKIDLKKDIQKVKK